MTPDAELAVELMKLCGVDPYGVSRLVVEVTRTKTTLTIERRQKNAKGTKGPLIKSVCENYQVTATRMDPPKSDGE